MAKETMIVFVYDTECLKDEADDPVKAVLYFHPSWVSDTQKVALCGQLMGTSYFLKDCFFKPKIMALQNGKFVLKEFGRFTLAVGTDRNISDYLLEQRADLLASLVKFFHRDLQSLFDQFPQQAQYKNLSEKLYHIFETYLPILQRNGHIFQNVPKLRMPKTASNIFLDAIQTLQGCQQTKGILGGAVLYHNKVVASQLGDTITKQLVLTDPLHIRTTAEQLHNTDFHIPNGVQMLVVYVDVPQYSRLAADAQRAQTLQTTQLSQGLLPFQYAKRKMKRDKSLIFTNIPEEGSTAGGTVGETAEEVVAVSQTPAAVRPKSLLIRPTHLPLRNRNGIGSAKELPESGIASINFDETDSYPEFIGRTSVCSTPMTENKVLQVGNIMSICANPEDESNSNKQKIQATNRRNSLKFDFEKFFQNFIANPNKQMERRNSFTDLQDSLKKISKKLSLKQFSHSFKTDVNRNGSISGIEALESPDFIENDDDLEAEQNSDNSDENNRTSRTITDPTYPVFNENGQPISRSLFQEFIEKYYRLWAEHGSGTDSAKKDVEIAQLIEEFKEFDNELKKLDESLRQDAGDNSNSTQLKADRNLNTEPAGIVPAVVKTPLDKKALSLPLKPLADAVASANNERELPCVAANRRQSGGVPLTPLMAKLSVLALNEEHNGSGGGWDANAVEIQTPLNTTKVFSRRNSLKCDDAVDALATLPTNPQSAMNGLKRLELYMCGQQNMTLLLLMEEGTARQQPVVQKMFDICVAKFPHMESHLNQTLNVNVEGDKRDGAYSFMSIDAKWDTLERNGPWNPLELNTLECMHQDLQPNDEISDLILRSHDAVYYGYKSGRSEFFYKEAAHATNGIPPPSDPMGNVTMRAKTHLERDHSYILF
uniref:Hermansky-Pudlak syndrome 4 protein n=1 Tax=Zeugodacus cucurbitae TaxID=28588 RepID=A0A0A1WJ60_ZEUCU